jgi:hypothetical protein
VFDREVTRMAEDKSYRKWATNQPSLRRLGSGKKETLLRGEGSILESISIGAALPEVLNRLCTAIDIQIRNVVSIILPAHYHEHDLHALMQGALQFGLYVFWSADIPLRNEDVLGSLEMYCCIPRTPTLVELRLIERVTHLAGQAIQRHNDEADFERSSRNWTSALRGRFHERVHLN